MKQIQIGMRTFACNSEGYGLFRKSMKGEWMQEVGTGETPQFVSPRAFAAWLRRWYLRANIALPKTPFIDQGGWK